MKQNEKLFTQMYDGTLNWGSDETASGPGSTLSATAHIRSNLEFLLKNLQIKTVCDLACGDFNFMKEIDFGEVKYIGCDIVKPLIEMNREKYANQYREFLHIDIIDGTCPEADLVFCKDLIIHISNNSVKRIINNIKTTKAEYFMSTTAFLPKVIMPGGKIGTVEIPETNVDLPLNTKHGYLKGDRVVNLFLPPFSFPSPLFLVGSAEHFQMMAVWKTKDIPNFEVEDLS